MQTPHVGRTFLESERIIRKQVERAWHQFVDHGSCATASVRDVVLNSWHRCRDEGIEATRTCSPLIAKGKQLEQLKQENEELLLASQHTWKMLSDILVDTESLLLVAAPSGVLLDVCGNPQVIEGGADQYVAPGYDWSEQKAGTNAVGTVIALREPVEIHSAEHFCQSAKIWTCSAAPVIDHVSGDLFGVIDITTRAHAFSRQSIALAMTAARQIEQTLQSRELARNVQLLDWFANKAERWYRDSVVLLDRRGRIITCNEHARRLFNNVQQGHLARSGNALLSLTVINDIENCAQFLPPGIDLVAVDSFHGARTWQGGLLVLENRNCRDMPVAQSRFVEKNRRDASLSVDPFANIVGDCALMERLKETARRCAATDDPLLIRGESGTGKELLARALHAASPRRDGPFVTVNCAELENYSAGEVIFGCEHKGLARRDTDKCAGKIALASGGTLFLRAVDMLPAAIQVQLLRFLQQELSGANEPHAMLAGVRIMVSMIAGAEVAGTDAQAMDRNLYLGLQGVTLHVPALRDRAEDLPALVDYLLEQTARRSGSPRKFADAELLQWMQRYPWPGNVGELYGMLEPMCVFSEQGQLSVRDLPDELCHQQVSANVAGHMGKATHDTHGILNEVEKKAIALEMEKHAGNRTRAARSLGISRSTLYRKLRAYGIDSA